MRFEEGGLSLWYGTADAAAASGELLAANGSGQAQVSITVGMQPPSASNAVEVTYRVNGGSPSTVAAVLLSHDAQRQAQYFQAKLPAFHVGDRVDYLVVGRAPGHQVPGPQQAGQFTTSFHVVASPAAHAVAAVGVRCMWRLLCRCCRFEARHPRRHTSSPCTWVLHLRRQPS
jgi:hypothetical protein